MKNIPLRMADYCLRIHRRSPEKKILQFVIYLTPTKSQEVYRSTFELPQMRHDFNVIRLWEQPTEHFLQQPGLLPFAPLTNAENRVAELSERVRQLPAEQLPQLGLAIPSFRAATDLERWLQSSM
ncbi:MAG: DUF4351 domain-containing protein [Cyanobacteria bacterium J06614_10]